MDNIANPAAGASEPGGKESLKQRAVHELERYAIITAYLWLLFALFGLYRDELLREHGISVWRQGFAIVNALIFGKVVLVAQHFEVGKSLERRALAWVVLGKATIFAALLIAFHIAEEAIRAGFKGEPLSTSFAGFGGTLFGLLTYAAIFLVTLIPFFAFQEAARMLGRAALSSLFFGGGGRRFRLVEDPSA